MLATFGIPLLAACGLAWWQSLPAGDSRREWNTIRGPAVLIAALMGAILFCAWKFPLPRDDPGTTFGNALVRIVFFVAILGGLIWLRREANPRLQRWFQVGLVMPVWFDGRTHAPNLSP